MVGQLSMSSLLNNPLSPSSPLCCISDNIPAGIQGARHAQCGLSSSDLHFNKLQAGLLPFGFKELERSVPPSRLLKGGSFMTSFDNDENISCLLTMGNTSPTSTKRKETQTPTFMLFGRPILTEQQMSLSCSSETVGNSLSNGNPEKMMNLSEGSGSAVIHNGPPENSSGEVLPWYKDQKLEFRMETGHCKVFMESEDVGRTLDLSVLGSYEELYKKLADMFGVGTSEMLSNVLYQDLTGTVKHTGDEPFSQFVKTARRLTILTDSGSDNIRR
nr:PREDICTED: auxin response factor 18-like [Nicotiana tabacum]